MTEAIKPFSFKNSETVQHANNQTPSESLKDRVAKIAVPPSPPHDPIERKIMFSVLSAFDKNATLEDIPECQMDKGEASEFEKYLENFSKKVETLPPLPGSFD